MGIVMVGVMVIAMEVRVIHMEVMVTHMVAMLIVKSMLATIQIWKVSITCYLNQNAYYSFKCMVTSQCFVGFFLNHFYKRREKLL